jgi:hypothetical protein
MLNNKEPRATVGVKDWQAARLFYEGSSLHQLLADSSQPLSPINAAASFCSATVGQCRHEPCDSGDLDGRGRGGRYSESASRQGRRVRTLAKSCRSNRNFNAQRICIWNCWECLPLCMVCLGLFPSGAAAPRRSTSGDRVRLGPYKDRHIVDTHMRI